MAYLSIFSCAIFLFPGLFCKQPHVLASATWLRAHATFHGGSDGSALLNDGESCGGRRYRIVCDAANDPQWCLKGKSITITATDYCPPNYRRASENGGCCNPPRPHFDLSRPAFQAKAKYRAGIVPILYRKVTCKRRGGFRFTINVGSYFELVLISNVGGAGEISKSWIKGSKSNKWEAMTRNWGANWQSLSYLMVRACPSDSKPVMGKS
ncbi:putative expansin-A17 [Populus alba]|uniref:putative expansin-A17 n=1 Tax=Populus alba TaxID=43335 RepID=UPI00158840DF|nr:putative expansin-A17 [Populus alba]